MKPNPPLPLQRLAVAIALASGGASAATITVNSSDDTFASPLCNLRAAIDSINAATATPACAAATSGAFGNDDTVAFAAALAASTITLAQGQIQPTKPVTIQGLGSGPAIDGANASPVLYATYGDLVVNDLTIRNGSSAYTAGGVSIVGGALTLSHVTMSGNHGAAGAVGAFGGQFGTIRIEASYLHDNTATSSGGAVSVQNGDLTLVDTLLRSNSSTNGGGALSLGGGSITAVHCALAANSAPNGGAISAAGNVVLERTTFTGNSATQAGGVAWLTNSSATLTIVESLLSANSAANGGAIALTLGGSIDIVNSTLTGNTASASGGAIYGKKYPHVVLTNATITGNSAAAGGGMSFKPDGNYGTSSLSFSNSIVSANSAASGADLGGTFSELVGNNNLFGTAMNTPPFNDAGRANVFSDTPGLGPLQDNGGATWTRALLPGSPAIGAGSNAAATGLTTDQRGVGFARVVDGIVDIGAYEYLGEDRIFLGNFEPQD